MYVQCVIYRRTTNALDDDDDRSISMRMDAGFEEKHSMIPKL